MSIGQRRQREREARQTMILDAAERVIAQRGLWATTMEDVAAAAELSKGTLYLYFANKDSLCAALAARTMALAHPPLYRAMEAQTIGIEKLRVGLRAMGSFLAAHPHIVRMAMSWMLAGVQATDSDEFAAYRQHVATTMRHALAAIEIGRKDGSIRADVDPQLTAVFLWTSLLGTLIATVQREDLAHRIPFTLESDGLLDFYVDNVLRGLQGTAPGTEIPETQETPPVSHT